ncbi:MAG: Nif3-like dinuclear metal center hexameric protein [Clostridia bacterium]|nr:Nif3-like dinuclear metal center hexameric protein [Clostridia bacterium]
MKIAEILKIFDNAAPLSLSADAQKNIGFYDNSGLLIDCATDTDTVVCALDLNNAVIDKAIELNAKLIITHHPAIYHPIKNIQGLYSRAAVNGISIYSAHLCLDSAFGGIDDGLAQMAGCVGEAKIVLYVNETNGFGRIFSVEQQTAESIVNRVIATLNTNKYMFFGDKNTIVNSVATFCGAGLNDGGVNAAINSELLISADIPHHVLLNALEKGKCVLQLTHYASEAYVMKNFCEKLFSQNKINSYFYADERFL